MPRLRLYSFSALRRNVIWTGTCGFGRRQADVLGSLDAVEIQETFYRPVPVVILFETPASFGPTDAHRMDLFRFFESIETESVKGIELSGPWASHLVERICDELGLVHVVDPFDREPATYGLAYFRLHGNP